MSFNDIYQTTRKHLRGVIVFLVMINIVAMLSFGLVFNNHINYINAQLNNNIVEYNEVDREQLCKISQCIKVIDIKNNKVYEPDRKNHLKRVDKHVCQYSKIYNSLYISDGNDIAIYNKESSSYYVLDTKKMFNEYILLMLFFIPLSLIIYLIPLIRSIKEEKEEALLMTAGSEALLANKSMINITENIHHELNTPLEVIDNKIEKIHAELSNFLVEEYEATEHLTSLPEDRISRNKRLVKLNEDFEFIKTSSEQIYAVLEKMKGFKHLRYSNGNKSIKNIIDGGFKIINISNTNFDYKVDTKLAGYKIGTSKLKNADFLSIILNHLKNSLEANASKIFIMLSKEEENHIKIRIIDNGNGIPKEAQKKIFSANFSTKNSDSGIRGNGMYLNKHIIKNAGGDINLISSSPKGTTIELTVPAIKK